MPDASIVVENLTKTFGRSGRPQIRAVDGLSFSVRRGSIFGLLGPNGAGKTTTLRVLTTLVRPTAGRATHRRLRRGARSRSRCAAASRW